MRKKDKYQIMSGVCFILLGLENLGFGINELVLNGQIFPNMKYLCLSIIGLTILILGILTLVSDTADKESKDDKK